MDRSNIRVKAYAVFQRKNGHVLANEVREKDGTLIGFRIPGGHVEFQEKGYDAVCREIQEEISLPVKNISYVGMMENMFVYQDIPGHEVIFLYKAEFADHEIYDADTIKGFEENATTSHFDFLWIDPHNPPAGTRVFPEGLVDLIKQ